VPPEADLLLEYQEAEQNLAHLRERAIDLAEDIDTVRAWLQSAVSGSDPCVEVQRSDALVRSNVDQYIRALDFDRILMQIESINAAETKLKELAQRKAALGLK
jgi:hypothetical protein